MLALLYDVHGNLPALSAVLDDAAEAGATRYVLGGDYALFGAWPAETVERLRAVDNARWIRGNGERWTAGLDEPPPDAPVVRGAIAAAQAALGPDLVTAMGDLVSLSEDRDALICHGSPPSDVRSFLPEAAEDEAELLDGVHHTRVIFGHTHLPFQRVSAGGIELVNPGSVGMPFDGDTRAAYALIHPDHTVEHRRVEYDVSATVARLRSLGEPWAETVAKRVEQAQIDV